AALIARDFRASLSHAQAATRMDRFSERAHRTEMLALYAMGRANEALEAYRRLRCLLVGELGLEPNAESRSLEAAILRQDDVSSLLPRPSREMQLRSGGHPWLLFLGRRAELAALAETLDSALAGEFALVLVEGEAGIGKSRLLDEFASTLDGVRVARARCSALEQHLAHVPLAAALRDVLDGLDLDIKDLPALGGIVPELAPREHPLNRLAETTRIQLEPLTDHELAPLGIPDVHGRTGGHPALVANLIASGSDPDLRGSLSELLIARCRAEGAAAFRVLMTAS